MEILGYIVIAIGIFLVLSGSLGMLRFPDFFSRIHAAGVTDSLGAPITIFGLILLDGFGQTSAKLLILMIILLVTSPTACHDITKEDLRNKKVD